MVIDGAEFVSDHLFQRYVHFRDSVLQRLELLAQIKVHGVIAIAAGVRHYYA
jgi:hypothetical protein